MTTLVLYGFLAEKYGKTFEFNARTPREAVALLRANFPGVTKDIVDYKPGFKVIVDATPIREEDLENPCKGHTIRLVPGVSGSGKWGMLIAGIALIVFTAGAATPLVGGLAAGMGATAATTAAGLAVGAASTAALASIGYSLVLSGISQLLFKPPENKVKVRERPENDPSYGFNGPINSVAQGNNVPVLYGELLVGSQTISSGIRTEQLK